MVSSNKVTIQNWKLIDIQHWVSERTVYFQAPIHLHGTLHEHMNNITLIHSAFYSYNIEKGKMPCIPIYINKRQPLCSY